MLPYGLIALALTVFMSAPAEAREKRLCSGDEATVSCLKENFDALYEKGYIQFQIIIGHAERKAESCTSVNDTAVFLDLAPKTKGNLEVEEYFKEFVETKFVRPNPECLLNALLQTGDDTRKVILGDYLRKPFAMKKDEVDKALAPFRAHEKFKEMLKLYFGE